MDFIMQGLAFLDILFGIILLIMKYFITFDTKMHIFYEKTDNFAKRIITNKGSNRTPYFAL